MNFIASKSHKNYKVKRCLYADHYIAISYNTFIKTTILSRSRKYGGNGYPRFWIPTVLPNLQPLCFQNFKLCLPSVLLSPHLYLFKKINPLSGAPAAS